MTTFIKLVPDSMIDKTTLSDAGFGDDSANHLWILRPVRYILGDFDHDASSFVYVHSWPIAEGRLSIACCR